MSINTIPEAARDYLEAVRKGLADLPAEDAEEVLQDLESHVAELGEVDPSTELGTPEEFIKEFRASAGLDVDPNPAPGAITRAVQRVSSRWNGAIDWTSTTFEPVLRPLTRNRAEIRTTWIWTRGLLALLAFAWITDRNPYDPQWFLGNGFGTGMVIAAIATYASVRLSRSSGRLWRRTDVLLSVGAAAILLVAMWSPRWSDFPQEVAYYDEPFQEAYGAPVLLIGPNGPIQNLYPYDLEGNPVDVLLYDEYGNPIQTLPGDAYFDYEAHEFDGYPFVWEGYEIRFHTDARGNPIGNLFPLERYEWTETGARSAPQPPPVVVIPQAPRDEAEAEAVIPETETTTSPAEDVPQETTATEPPTTTTEG